MAKSSALQSKRPASKVSRDSLAEAMMVGDVWQGVIARLRVYDQPASTGKKVFAYLEPGHNDDYVGWTDDPNVIHALFLARDNGRQVQGYANITHRIEWLDY